MSVRPGDPTAFEPGQPVSGVTWHEAVEFCRRLSARDGRAYRLPTEAEWEYACRAGTRTPWAGAFDEVAWAAAGGSVGGTASPRVRTKRPNAWGLFDMHGGVAEWCLDSGDLTQWPTTAPAVDPLSPETGLTKAIRGGSHAGPPGQCRSAARASLRGYMRRPDLGFRVIVPDAAGGGGGGPRPPAPPLARG